VKSSLSDELLRRFRLDQEDKLRVAVLAVDPTRRRGGGALLGDRIRMNSLQDSQVFFRSTATRTSTTAVPERLADAVAACKAAGFDQVVVETPGIGQGDATISTFCDVSLYVTVLDPEVEELLASWPETLTRYTGEEFIYTVRGREIHTSLRGPTLSGPSVPRVALPRTSGHADIVRLLRSENVPGRFPHTAGVFPFERQGEAPAHVRRRGRRVPHEPAVQGAVQR
jgi:hypothetical protein